MTTRNLRLAASLTALIASVVLFQSTAAYAAKEVKVRVGTPDLAGPGGDGNFSLVAQIDAAGNVSGQWQDAFTQNQGFHIDVTCLTVVGNQAWVGGVVTQAANPAFVGIQARTLVVDGGLPGGSGDSISFTFIFPNGGAPDCAAQPAFPLTPFEQGQVSIK